MRHVAGTKCSQDWCIRSHEGTCRCNMSLRQVPATFSCGVQALCNIFPATPLPATCPSVCTTCRCDMSLLHDPSCLTTLNVKCLRILKQSSLFTCRKAIKLQTTFTIPSALLKMKEYFNVTIIITIFS